MRPILERLALGEIADFEGLPAGVRVADMIAAFSPVSDGWVRLWFDPEYRVLLVDFLDNA
jgi:hypothetical protein